MIIVRKSGNWFCRKVVIAIASKRGRKRGQTKTPRVGEIAALSPQVNCERERSNWMKHSTVWNSRGLLLAQLASIDIQCIWQEFV